MNYVKIKIKDEELKLRLTVEKACELEDDMGKNPLMMFAEPMPRITDLKKVFIYSGGSAELLQDYFDDGNRLSDLTKLVMDIFKASGFIKESESKNA